MLDIVVPVYNEKDNIEKLLNEIDVKIHVIKKLLIIYDQLGDNTLPVLETICKKYSFPIIIEQNIFGNGALNAIRTGFIKSDGEAVLVTMADLSDDLSVVDDMYSKILLGNKVVCGSRYMKGGKQVGGPVLKKIFSRLAGLSLHWLIHIPTHDVTNSFKMYSKTLLNTFLIESKGGFELGLEITVKAFINGFQIIEIPATWYDRTKGKSHFKMWTWLPCYLHWYFYGIINFYLKKKRLTHDVEKGDVVSEKCHTSIM